MTTEAEPAPAAIGGRILARDPTREIGQRPPSVPTPPTSLALAALAVALLTAATTFWVVGAVRDALASGEIQSTAIDVALYAFGAATLLLFVPAVASRCAPPARRAPPSRATSSPRACAAPRPAPPPG